MPGPVRPVTAGGRRSDHPPRPTCRDRPGYGRARPGGCPRCADPVTGRPTGPGPGPSACAARRPAPGRAEPGIIDGDDGLPGRVLGITERAGDGVDGRDDVLVFLRSAEGSGARAGGIQPPAVYTQTLSAGPASVPERRYNSRCGKGQLTAPARRVHYRSRRRHPRVWLRPSRRLHRHDNRSARGREGEHKPQSPCLPRSLHPGTPGALRN